MDQNRSSRWMALSSLAILMLLACNLSNSSAATVAPQSNDTLQSQSKPAVTDTIIQPTSEAAIQPTDPSKATQKTEAAASEPACTVLQDVNLRSGPGTAYRPPIKMLSKDTTLTPLGFVPQGIPGGSWAYVQDRASQEKGWVSAGSQYISCNIEFSTLPALSFNTPVPPPLPKTAQTSDPDGNGFCVDQGSGIKCVGTFKEESLFQFQMFKNGKELGKNKVDQVNFVVKTANGKEVYNKNETSPEYCIFGGDGPCNPWTYVNDVPVWTQDGKPVKPGKYELDVNVTLKDGETSLWLVTFKIDLP